MSTLDVLLDMIAENLDEKEGQALYSFVDLT